LVETFGFGFAWLLHEQKFMSQLFVDEENLRSCHVSRIARVPITITGRTRDGLTKTITGVVQSVEVHRMRGPGSRYRVTILDPQEPPATI